MRDQGRLVEWFDDKGYGFIQPNDPSKAKVFLHIKDFARPGPRPIVGCALEYLVILDGQGRCRAQQASYLNAAQARHLQGKIQAVPEKVVKLQPMQIVITAYLLSLGILSLSGHLAGLVLLGILLTNGISYWMCCRVWEAGRQPGWLSRNLGIKPRNSLSVRFTLPRLCCICCYWVGGFRHSICFKIKPLEYRT